jgi:hypothetical protein
VNILSRVLGLKTKPAPVTHEEAPKPADPTVENKANMTRRDALKILGKFGIACATVGVAGALQGCDVRYRRAPVDQNFDINQGEGKFEGQQLPEVGEVSKENVVYLFDQYLSDIGFPLSFDDFLELDESRQFKLKDPTTFNDKVKVNLGYGADKPYISYNNNENQPQTIIFDLKKGFITIKDESTNTFTADANFGITKGQFAVRSRETDTESTEELPLRLSEKVINSKGLICEGTHERDKSTAVYYQKDKPGSSEIRGTADLLDMLGKNDGHDYPFKSTKINLRDIKDVNQLMQIYYYFSGKPESMKDFVISAMAFEFFDKGMKDEYRHPLDSLKSGWGDCDDFVVLAGFWAKLNGHKVKYVFLPNHVFAFVTTKDNKNYAFDSQKPEYFHEANSLNSYMKEYYKDPTVDEITEV